MQNITPNVSFDVIAREWRCKWTEDNEKASLVALQDLLNTHLATLKGMEGAKVQRIVAKKKDFKVIIALPAASYKPWSDNGHAPEADFTKAMGEIAGVTQVETQTYTIMEL